MASQFKPPDSGEKPSLANPDVVLDLVNRFESEVLEARGSFFRGVPGAENSAEKVLDLCSNYGDIFEGNDKGYERPEWGHMTVAWMRFLVSKSKDEEALAMIQVPFQHQKIGKAFFLLLAKAVMQVSDKVAEGMSQEQATAKIEDINNHFTDILLAMRS